MGRSLGPPAIGAEAPRKRVWLRFLHDRQDFELGAGVTIVGRGDGCQLVLDDPLISRRHACFLVENGEVTVKDLGSTNGVLVNGSRIDEIQALVPGDHITLGHHQAELCWVPFSAAERVPRHREPPSRRPAAETMVDQRSSHPAVGQPAEVPESEVTHETDVLEMLAGVAEKAFELGRGADAERILRQPLETLLMRAEAGQSVEPRQAEHAAMLAARLGRATQRGQWVDYVFKLFAELERLPPTTVIDELHITIRAVPGVSVSQFRMYLDLMRSTRPDFSPAERFLLRRLESLEGVLIA